MSKQQINTYYNQLEKLIRFGGSHNETSIRRAFSTLVNAYADKRNLLLVEEIGVTGKKGNTVFPDGVLKNATRFEFGYWESKDSKDDLNVEINKKLKIDGYPDSNILFEDTTEAVLFQEGQMVQRVQMKDAEALDSILEHFINYEPSIVKDFNKALEKFKEDIPAIVEDLRDLIERETTSNAAFLERRVRFHALAQSEINPEITLEDIREMLIQHILTEDIFNNVFGNANFHKFNNIARELVEVLDTFMTYAVRQQHLSAIRSYYDTIRDASAGLADHHEKQKFLKNIYENFYKVYNPKGADRLGVVYTPNEIVKFMIESTDWLLEKHFGKSLGDRNVEILDPATGTGTFIAELIEHINVHDLPHKYKNEIHANEVAILPYYIANLNIEFTYQQKMSEYVEFRNICFVDTLDNTDGLNYSGQQMLLGGISSENAARIKRQNEKKISVIIGNPPYNANQKNFNEFNANRKYPEIDKRVKKTYVHHSTAQKTKAYDMYSRFLRWTSDRIDKNGVVAFVSNNSFVNARTLDGLRKCLFDEFNEIWVVNLKGNANTSGERRKREAGNIFNDEIKVGVAIYFLVKNEHRKGSKIFYNEVRDYAKRGEKTEYIRDQRISKLKFDKIEPDSRNNWIEIPDDDSDFDELLPLADKDVKLGRKGNAVFTMFSLGVVTARNEWAYAHTPDELSDKIGYLIDSYNHDLKFFKGKTKEEITAIIKAREEADIKWTRAVINDISSGTTYKYDAGKIIKGLFRPFVKMHLYFAKELNEMQYQMPKVFRKKNTTIAFSGEGSAKPFQILAQDTVFDHDLLEKTQCLPFYVYLPDGTRHENISDWAVDEFARRGARGLTKEDIFNYVYAVLHYPPYREKYEQNLKRDFPRIPVYANALTWSKLGKELMELHLNYESVDQFDLRQVDLDLNSKEKGKLADFFSELDELDENTFTIKPVLKLRADKAAGVIEIDTKTRLEGIPAIAWEYKLGNRSALEWILDQYKERKPKDPTIAEKFTTYKFADYKDHVIDLLKRVCTVSVKTMELIRSMPKEGAK